MANCIGSVISVDCGEKGYMQGTLIAVDPNTQAITLGRPFKDGVPLGKDCIVNGADVVSFKVIRPVMNHQLRETPSDSTVGLPLSEESNSVMSDEPSHVIVADTSSTKGKKWVSRPISTSKGVFKPLNFESSSESGTSECPSTTSKSQSGIDINQGKSRCHRSVTTSMSSDSNEATLLDTTPTPLFQRYEPQIPMPQKLRNIRQTSKANKKHKGPSGIPSVDAQNGYGRVYPCNRHLTKPLDAFDDDFDFESNFEEFSKDSMKDNDDQYFEMIEKPKMSKNFAHYENILSDPANLHSWTTKSSKSVLIDSDCHTELPPLDHQFCSKVYEAVRDEVRLPVLDINQKAKYMKACAEHFGENVFYSMLTDKLLFYIFHIAQKYNLSLNSVVILHNNCILDVDRLLTSLLDRGTVVSIFSKTFSCSDGECVDDTSNLPVRPDVVIILGSSLHADCKKWLADQAVHCFSVESAIQLNENSKHHILMVGTLTEDIYKTPPVVPVTGPTSFALLCGSYRKTYEIDWVVCDVGAPFAWIKNGGDSLTSAFKHSLFVFS